MNSVACGIILLYGFLMPNNKFCQPRQFPKSHNGKPRYPSVPVSPESNNVHSFMDVERRIKTTTFQSTDTPRAILSYYEEVLLASGWDIVNKSDISARYRYTNGDNNPAFGLGVIVEQQEEYALVTLRQVISGPFWWDEQSEE